MQGRGIPRDAFYFYDIRSKMELERYGINFLSAQDLKSFYEEEMSKSILESSGKQSEDMCEKKKESNIYDLVEYFMKHHPDGYYFLDEVPFIKGIKS